MSDTVLFQIFLYSMTGLFTGFVSGTLGIGGGVIVVPTLVFIFAHNPAIASSVSVHMAIGSSLAIMIWTAFFAVKAHHKRGTIFWSVYRNIAPSLVLGTAVGGLLSDKVPTRWLEWILAIFLLIVAVQMYFRQEPTDLTKKPQLSRAMHYISGFLIGLPSGVLGMGGGALLIPYLTYSGIRIKEIMAVTALCTMTVAIFGTFIFMVSGLNEPGLPPYAIGYVYWPAVVCVAITSSVTAPLGVKIAYYISTDLLKYLFVIILILTSLTLIF